MSADEMTLERLNQIASRVVALNPTLSMVVGKPREDDRGGMGLFEASQRMTEAASIVRDGIYVGEGMGAGLWYIQKFSNEVFYFRCTGAQKNGSYAGTLVTVDLGRPKSKPKAKKSSVTKIEAKSQWNNIDVGQVPSEARSVAESYADSDLGLMSESVAPRGSVAEARLLLMSELMGRGWVALTDLARAKDLTGVHFKKIQAAADKLKDEGKVETKNDPREGLMLKLVSGKKTEARSRFGEAAGEAKMTCHVSYRSGKTVSENFDTLKTAQQWADKNHPTAGSVVVRAPTTSDGTKHEKSGKFFGRVLSQREGTGDHAKWVTEERIAKNPINEKVADSKSDSRLDRASVEALLSPKG